ncbi:MAG: electron transfer flavoprotein subunit alpha [Firmicutes bacterium]|nr:electron transfer flavoprotein subunit alpha [Bacillota bacterium]
MAVIIDKDLCVGCGACMGTCPNGAIDIGGDGKASVSDNCVNCGMCIDACPMGAISAPKEEIKESDEWSGIWVFCQQTDAQLLPVCYELVGKGRELADSCGQKLTAVVFGYNVWGLDSLIKAGADTVLYAEDRELSVAFEIPYAALMSRLISEKKPAVVLYGATPFGRTMAPMVAATLRTGLTADCTVLDIDEETGLLRQTRPAFGGNLMATIVCAEARPQMATVRPGVFTAPEPDESRKGNVEWVPWSKAADKGLKLLDFAKESEGKTLADFDVLVVAGRGIGQKKNLAVIKELAELLGGDFGVSRPLIDEGWAEYPHQVGQTGCSVAPKLLISLGVSGAIQHLAGISGAQTIIAVNTDPDAPIFGVADYAVNCDCIEFARAMIEQLKREKQGR